jgi:hypothetical protein
MSLEKELPLVYDHDQDDFKLAIGMKEDQMRGVAKKLSKISTLLVEENLTVSQITELIDISLTRNELLYVATMHVKAVVTEAHEE